MAGMAGRGLCCSAVVFSQEVPSREFGPAMACHLLPSICHCLPYRHFPFGVIGCPQTGEMSSGEY